MADNIYAKLKEKGYKPEQPLKRRKRVVTSEKGKSYVLEVRAQHPSAVYQVDGDIIRDFEKNKCDKLVLVDNEVSGSQIPAWTEIFVELKGKDVRHAIQQLEASIKESIFKHQSVVQRRARVVASSFPANSGRSDMELAKIRFKTRYDVDLKGMKNGQVDKSI